MSSSRAALGVLLALALAAEVGAGAEPPIELSGWKLTRFRYGQGGQIP